MSGFLQSLDFVDFIITIALLITTGGTAYLLAQKFGSQYGRVIQGGLLTFLAFIIGSPFGIITAVIVLIIGIADAVADEDSILAFLDPSLA